MTYVDNSKIITVLSLCSGYGGLELGLARALANPLRVVAVEIEAYALANLVAKAEKGKLAIESLWPDLRTFPAERFRGCFDFVLAGYPCQPFSVAGKRQGTDDPRHLWPTIARIVAAVEPIWCFFENVPGHLSLGFPDVYCNLRDMGYKVEAGLFTASECGAPHKRERLFILAHKQRVRLEERKIPKIETSRQTRKSSKWNVERSDCELANAAAQRVQGTEPEGPVLTRRPPDEQGTLWPARPGEPQYEWEEPRVVGDTTRKRLAKWQKSKKRDFIQATKYTNKRQAQSGVGRTVDGSSRRVDRLRLLGNGVVPQQAEKAFRELITLFDYEQVTDDTAKRS